MLLFLGQVGEFIIILKITFHLAEFAFPNLPFLGQFKINILFLATPRFPLLGRFEIQILDHKVPGIDKRLAEELVTVMHRIRSLDLKKLPSISETLDWARALLALNADELEDEVVSDTLSVILKYEGDVKKAQGELSKLIEKKSGEKRAEGSQPAPGTSDAKKGILH